MEFHVHKNTKNHSTNNNQSIEEFYRVFIHYGSTKDLNNAKDRNHSVREIYTNFQSLSDAITFYSQLHKKYVTKKYQEFHMISSNIGSNILNDSVSLSKFSILPMSIQSLVTVAYDEANRRVMENLQDTLKKIVQSPIGKLSLVQIEKCEVLLHQIFSMLKEYNFIL